MEHIKIINGLQNNWCINPWHLNYDKDDKYRLVKTSGHWCWLDLIPNSFRSGDSLCFLDFIFGHFLYIFLFYSCKLDWKSILNCATTKIHIIHCEITTAKAALAAPHIKLFFFSSFDRDTNRILVRETRLLQILLKNMTSEVLGQITLSKTMYT